MKVENLIVCEECKYREDCHNFDLFMVGCVDFDKNESVVDNDESVINESRNMILGRYDSCSKQDEISYFLQL